MKRIAFLATTLLCSGSLLAADSNLKDDVTKAAKALEGKPNYSWKATYVVPDDSPFHPGPTEGKVQKDGLTDVKLSFNDNTTEFFVKGEKAAITNPDGGWQSLSELDGSEGPGRFFAGMIRNFKTPAAQAAETAGAVKEMKKDGDVYSGDLTEEGAKALLTFRRGGGTASNAKGSAKFWIKDGALTQFEFKVTGHVSWDGGDMDVDRKTTVEVKDVGTTKIEVPEDAKKKMS
jgi:hypothetical protein